MRNKGLLIYFILLNVIVQGQHLAQDQLYQNVCKCVENIDTQIHSLHEVDVFMAHCLRAAIVSKEGRIVFGYSEEDINQNIVQKNIEDWQQIIIFGMTDCDAFTHNNKKINELDYDTNIYKGEGIIKALKGNQIYISNENRVDTFSILDYRIRDFYEYQGIDKKIGRKVFYEYKKERFINGSNQNNIQSLNIYNDYEEIFSRKNYKLVAEKIEDKQDINENSFFNIIKKYSDKLELEEKIKINISRQNAAYIIEFYPANNIHSLDSKKRPVYEKVKYYLTVSIDSLQKTIRVDEHFNNYKRLYTLSKKRQLERSCEKKSFYNRSLNLLALQYYSSFEEYINVLRTLDDRSFYHDDSLKYSKYCQEYKMIMNEIEGCLFEEQIYVEKRMEEQERKNAKLINVDSISYFCKSPHYGRKAIIQNVFDKKTKGIKLFTKEKLDEGWQESDDKYYLQKSMFSDSLVVEVFSNYILKRKIVTYTFNYKSGLLSEKLFELVKPSFPNFKERVLHITNKFERHEDQIVAKAVSLTLTIAEWEQYCKLPKPITADNIRTEFKNYLYAKSLEDIFKNLNIFNNLKSET